MTDIVVALIERGADVSATNVCGQFTAAVRRRRQSYRRDGGVAPAAATFALLNRAMKSR
jgi:hypothetical protein